MTDNRNDEWDALDGQPQRQAADAAMDELGFGEPPKRSRLRWLWLAVPVAIAAGALLLVWAPWNAQEPLPFEERADAFGYEQIEQTRLPNLAGMQRFVVAKAGESAPSAPATPAPGSPATPAPPTAVRPAPGAPAPSPHVAVNPTVRAPGTRVVPGSPGTVVPPVRVNPATPGGTAVGPEAVVPVPGATVPGTTDVTVPGTTDVTVPGTTDVAVPNVGPTAAPGAGVSPEVAVQPDVPVPDGPAMVEPDNPSPPPGMPDDSGTAEVVVPDPTAPTSPDDKKPPTDATNPDVAAAPDDPTTRHAVEPGTDTRRGSPGAWKLEGLAHTGPIEPGQDPRQSVPKPPDYFKPENMRDGFLILSQDANQGAWKLNRDDLFVREFHTPDGKSCVDFIWPGEGHLKDAEGSLAPDASFWIRPRQKAGNYSRYFDNQKADFYHWVGIEIPPEHKDEAAKMFEWKLASPKTPPPGWQPAGKVYEYKRGDKTRYMYVYQMPMGPLSSGVTNVDLRLYHKESGAYLGKNSHSVTIGGTTP